MIVRRIMLNFAAKLKKDFIPMQENTRYLRFAWSIVVLMASLLGLQAQTSQPKCTPTATFTYTALDSEGHPEVKTEELESFSGSAPVQAQFKANPSGLDDEDGAPLYSARYEWKIYDQTSPSVVMVHRFEEDLEYTFDRSGSYVVEVTATFVHDSDTVFYPEEGEDGTRFMVTIQESVLEMPNAFSPNNDGTNDVYRAKPTHQSIVSFRATIFNRWGQRLYSWDDVNGSWDGKVHGKVVPDGVYFVNVVAKGADGHEYRIRKDVNVLTRLGQNEGESTTGTGGEE